MDRTPRRIENLYLGSEEASHSWESHLARVTLRGEQDETGQVRPRQGARPVWQDPGPASLKGYQPLHLKAIKRV